eukprot:Gb_03103 [translate_table: standard]
MVLNCCMQILRRVVHPLRVLFAPLWLCLTAAADIDEIAQTSPSTQNDQNDYTRLPPVANFDVFINHRGKDVKDTLASHIYDLLQFHGVRAFLDREELRTGEEFPHAITEAIQSSSLYIAIFSPHYAESSWCLRELALMLKTPNATIIPVFYNVKPEELRWAKGAFAKAFDKHYRRYSQEMVDEWRAALQEVSNISGLSLSDFKGRLATKVVQEVLKRIKSEPLTVAEFPVGLEEHVARLREYIRRCRMEKPHVAFVGIIGIAGIGKTTLAKALFNNIRWDLNFRFERASFIEDIKGEAEKKGLQEIRRKLLQNLLHHDYQVLDLSQSQGQRIIRERLNNIDALIVLDNIEDRDQLDDILPPEVLLPGSTLIVTSRDSSIFNWCNNFLKYEMSGLNSLQSKELFCRHAFGSGVACASFENMVDKFLGICKGVPLALKICGREVCGSYASWKSYFKKITESMVVDPLKSMLKVSYDMLDEKQKQIFLDIAIFFHGEELDTIKRIWEDESEDSFKLEEDSEYSSTTYDLQILERKCMIQFERGPSVLVTMHEVFRDLGRAIVDEESPTNPGGRSRLWRPKDVEKVIKSFKGTENVRGLSLVFRGSVIWNRDRFGRACAWPADAFANMKELKLLELGDDCVEGDLGKLPQGLVWLRWRNYPYECMPPNLRINHARVLDFCGGKLVSLWDDQSQVPLKLQELNLQRCYKLQRVPDSICRLRGLQKLDFSHCLLLEILSEEFCNLESLEVLNLNFCLNLEYLPSGFGGMRRLRHVSLRKCKKLKALPESFGLLPQIEYLDMTHCKNVKIEEGSFGSISTLKEVYLLNCRKLETFPTQLTRQRSLKKLGVAPVDEDSRRIVGFGHNEIFIDIPENIGDLSKLTELRLGNLMGIPQSIGNLSHLVRFHLWGLANMRAIPDSIGLKNLCLLECPQLEGLQTCIGNLSCLSNLYLRDCPRLQELPTSIGNLSCLSELHLSNCPRLQELPTSIGNLSCLSELHLSNCPRLQELPTSIGNLSCLSELSLWNCPRLQELPTSIGNLSCLSSLILSNCSRLQELPTSIGNLSCLSSLQLWDCPRLQELPTSIGNLSCLSELHLSNCPRLQQLPTSMGNLSCLSQVRLWNCPRLQELPTSIGNLSCLSELRLSNCPRLQELPTSIGNLSCLSELQLLNCPRLQELPTSIGNLSCLSELQLWDCPRLQELPTSIGNLSCLSRLELWDCPRLQELPTSIGNLCCLSRLQLLDLPLTDSFLTEENSVLLKVINSFQLISFFYS